MSSFEGFPEWKKALSLAGRAPFRKSVASTAGFDAALAEKRLLRWKKDGRLDDQDRFAHWLSCHGLNEDEFRRLLVLPAEQLDAPLPDWVRRLTAAYGRRAGSDQTPLNAGEGSVPMEFLELVQPLLDDGRRRFRTALEQSRKSGSPIGPGAAAVVEKSLAEQVRAAIGRTLVQELQIQRLEGCLKGERPEDRYQSFLEKLRNPPQALEILRQYPVLSRLLTLRVEQWREAGLEFLTRLAADRELLENRFGISRDDALQEIEFEKGDRHRNGRSVGVAVFDSGARVVYKPRSMAVERRFQGLLGWLNQNQFETPFRILEVADRGDYGWMEFAQFRPCRDQAEAERFFFRQGAYLALLYALRATDFHHENVIAAGEHPLLVDVETLMPPSLEAPAAPGIGHHPLGETVQCSGLLPWRMRGSDPAGVDFSGLGSGQEQHTHALTLVDEGTDRMRFVVTRAVVPAAANRPLVEGREIPAWKMRDPIVAGFEKMYRFLQRRSAELLREGGPLWGFRNAPIRVILRGTTTYFVLLNAASHPDYLRDALDRDRLFSRLWLEVGRYGGLEQVVMAEKEDLERGDVPRFQTTPASKDLDVGGSTRRGFFAKSGWEKLAQRLGDMSERDLRRQVWVIDATLEAARPADPNPRRSRKPLPAVRKEASPEDLVAGAERIADRLDELTFRNGPNLCWFAFELVGGQAWDVRPAPVDLYDGLCGIALFYAQLGAIGGAERRTRKAREVVDTIRRRLESEPGQVHKIGAFSGWGGVVYALTFLGALWGDGELLAEAERRALEASDRIEEDDELDLISGAAGLLAAVAARHRHGPSEGLKAVAQQCGRHLLSRSVAGLKGGIAWPSPRQGEPHPLTGFGHGAAGIAWSLLELAALSGETRCRDAALEAFRYERGWFCARRRDWPDLRLDRVSDGRKAVIHAWCHGAPGIGLARAAALSTIDNDEIRQDLERAVSATLRDGFGLNHSLCHGDLGNLDMLLIAAGALDDKRLRRRTRRLAAQVHRSTAEGLRCGASVRRELPGLMTGLAGIGYGLLRAACPERVPSPLLLQTPRPTNSQPPTPNS